MCLISKSSELIVADKDIECYKVVECGLNSLIGAKIGAYITAILNQYIPRDVVKGERPFIAKGEIKPKQTKGYWIFKRGLIHTYRVFEAAKECQKYLNVLDDMQIYRCIIPKGTKYVIGTDDLKYSDDICYASEQIVFKERVL